jgi:RNA polymerase sigma factor (sigma-70 family)
MPIQTGSRSDRQLLTDFTSSGDEEAFAELVRRHGPMVLGVCRRMLRSQHDAEDTFQATFLVLAQKAASIRSPEALPSWLYGVATRLANRTRATVSRRHAREGPLVDTPSRESPDAQRGSEMWCALSEEISRLPDRYRLPFVLCYLDGKTNEEAARLLKCAAGTIFSRLARARQRLRERLGRRGIAVSAAVLAMTLSSWRGQAHAAVAAELLHKTIRGAIAFKAASGKGTAGVSARVAKLAQWQIATAAGIGIKAVVAVSVSGALLTAVASVSVWRATAQKPTEQYIQGVWVLQSMTMHGQPIPLEGQPRPRITLGENGSLVSTTTRGTYVMDTRARPMQMTWTLTGTSMPGIFELQGDSLTVCMTLGQGDLPSLPLPTDFTPGPGKAVMTYSRERP